MVVPGTKQKSHSTQWAGVDRSLVVLRGRKERLHYTVGGSRLMCDNSVGEEAEIQQ
jgi:hypothetical protein